MTSDEEAQAEEYRLRREKEKEEWMGRVEWRRRALGGLLKVRGEEERQRSHDRSDLLRI